MRLRTTPMRCGRAVLGAGSCALTLLLIVTACQSAAHPAARATRAATIMSCGTGDPVPAYGNHRSYSPWDPAMPPPGARITRCFASLAQASARGYPPGGPQGTLIVDGVFLEPTGMVTFRQCRAAARTLGYPVPCPGVAPAVTSQALSCSDGSVGGGCTGTGWFMFEEDGFSAPPGYRGVFGQPDGHFVLEAFRVGPSEDRTIFCGKLLRVMTVEGARATISDCIEPGALFNDHVILSWVHRGVLVDVTFHGFTATNIALDLAVAHHLVWVGARR